MNNAIESLGRNVDQLREGTREAGNAAPSPQQNQQRQKIVQEVIVNSGQLAAQAQLPERDAIEAFQRGLRQAGGETAGAGAGSGSVR